MIVNLRKRSDRRPGPAKWQTESPMPPRLCRPLITVEDATSGRSSALSWEFLASDASAKMPLAAGTTRLPLEYGSG